MARTGPAVRSDSLLERRGFEPAVPFRLSPPSERPEVWAVFVPLFADRRPGEKTSPAGSWEMTALKSGVAEVELDGSRVLAGVGQVKARRVAQRVGVDRKVNGGRGP